MLRHFTIARILEYHVSVGNRGLPYVGTISVPRNMCQMWGYVRCGGLTVYVYK